MYCKHHLCPQSDQIGIPGVVLLFLLCISDAKKKKTLCFLSNFWEVNTRLVRKPFPIPKTSMVLQEVERFSFATALHLNMGYYTIRLDPDASKMCTIIFPWGKYS
jgi:hypothetical protein